MPEKSTGPSPSRDPIAPSGPGLTRRAFLDRALRSSGGVGSLGALNATGLGFAQAATAETVPGSPAAPQSIRRRVQLGRTDLEVPDISFGSFSLERDPGLVLHAVDRGITHFDTAESYTEGRAETVLGQALAQLGSRKHDITLTSKYWAKAEDSAAHQMKVLEESLRRLGVEQIDLYLNHAVNDVARISSPEWQAFVDRAKSQGKIRYSGLSGHAGRLAECLEYALDEQLADVFLVAYNFSQQPSFRSQLKQYLKDFAASFDLITTHPRLPALLARAHAEGVGVMVMKTLKGARLNDMRPFEAPGRTFAQAAFRFVLSDPSVDSLVVSMTSRTQIDEYVAASGAVSPDLEDLALLGRYEARNAGTLCQIGCASECVERCPAQVPVPDVMRMRMYDRDYQIPAVARREYASLASNAAACLECSGHPCQGACPVGLDIAKLNRDTHTELSGAPPTD